jgi:hypothetical protein
MSALVEWLELRLCDVKESLEVAEFYGTAH